jgi:ComF family protein
VLSRPVNFVARILLAPGCLSCRRPLPEPLSGPVCETCWNKVRYVTPPFCRICGDALASAENLPCPRCRAAPPAFDIARSAARHEGVLRDVIHAFKYQRCRYLAEPLARLMASAGREVMVGADAVVPVPLHPLRGFSRGFNQADDLSCALGLPVWRVLRRTRAGPPQAQLSGHRREVNVHGAFAIRGAGRRRRAIEARLRHRTVVLVDDVMTTGATLDACGQVLINAGVSSVRVLTAARAWSERPSRWLRTPPPGGLPRR